MGCSDSISSPRTGVEAILTELGPENQNRRYVVSSHINPRGNIRQRGWPVAGDMQSSILTAAGSRRHTSCATMAVHALLFLPHL